MSIALSATRRHALEDAERMLTRPLTTVRRVAVAAVTPFPTATLTRIVARAAARHRRGRILLTTPEWELFPEPSGDRVAPPGAEGRLRASGAVWVGAPDLDDRYFDVTVADAGVLAPSDVTALARARDAVCLVVPLERSAAEESVALAEQLTAEGRRVVVVFDRTRPGRDAWARAVAPRLRAPALVLRADPALLRPGRPLAARTLLTAAEVAGHLMTDPVPAEAS